MPHDLAIFEAFTLHCMNSGGYMQKFIPIALLAILIVGCKGGDTTAATTGGSTGTATTGSTPSADKTFTFKFAPKAGDKFSYGMKVDGGPQQQMEMGMTMVCDKVDGDKSTLTMSIDSMKMNGADAPAAVLDAMKKSKTTMEMDSTGKTLSVKSDTPGATTSGFAGASFPTKAVKVGDEWEGTSSAGGKETKAKYKLASIENVGGKELAVLEVTPEAMAGVTIEGPMIVKIDVANGMTHSMTMKGKTKDATGKEVPMSMEMSLK